MKILVTGVNGQLGHDVMNKIYKQGIISVGCYITEKYNGAENRIEKWASQYRMMDITDKSTVLAVIREADPDAVIHCAAWTAVDAAEEAEVCRQSDCKLMYISTDYVFNGEGEKPWEPDCKDYEPLNVYGKKKLEGELAVAANTDKHFIVRIAWAFGLSGRNFIDTMISVVKKHKSVRVVYDQVGTPTYTCDLARLLVDMILTDKYGYYHATNEGGYISWYDFTCEIFRQAGITTEVVPVTTEEYGVSKAKRPYNSRLDKSKLIQNGFKPLPDWKDALERYLWEIEL